MSAWNRTARHHPDPISVRAGSKVRRSLSALACGSGSGFVLVSTGMRSGFTLLELVVAVIVLMVIVNFAIPQYRVATEQNRVDLAGSRLLMIYTAQRMYFVDNQTFAPTLNDLVNAKLLDPQLSSDSKYTYSITSASATGFTALATRAPQFFSGDLTINEKGILGGNIHSTDSSIILTASKYALGL